jgi:two-component sensor histidine kinase/CheY-like chemotaxis protein
MIDEALQHGKPSIMVVDDTPANLEILSAALTQWGYKVRTAPGGRLALQAAQNDPPDLVLLDIMMPEMDGYEVCRRLKEDDRTRDVPVIFVTALDSEEGEEKGLSVGAVDYITKPFRLPIVRARVQAHLQLKMHRDRLEDLVTERTEKLEKEIAERRRAEKQIMESLGEKEVLLREIHHRVKNNMQIISSLLSLQARTIDDEALLRLYKDAERRIFAMALVHEKLYRSSDLARIDFSEYIKSLAGELAGAYQPECGGVALAVDADRIDLGVDQAIPCGLILNEILTNTFKYAFPSSFKKKKKIFISLHDSTNGGRIEFIIGNNGVDMPADIDLETADSLGLSLLNILVKQLNGEIRLRTENGLTYTITFSKL